VSTITTKDGVEIFYKDWGKGQPIVFSHGWPLSADDWDAQILFFLNKGFRVIAHDRRGHGRSTQVGDGHDMDHYADDLAALTAHLGLKNAVHVGHSLQQLPDLAAELVRLKAYVITAFRMTIDLSRGPRCIDVAA
jgi:non-heme chloroperoxidase